jgi:hypothetical protein
MRTTLSQPMPSSPEQPHRSQTNIAAIRIQLSFAQQATPLIDPSGQTSPSRFHATYS